MSLDARRLLARPFHGLGGDTSQMLLQMDQTIKRQIADALAGRPVAGNPFPSATPEQLALALAGSTAWKPWNQSKTIEQAVANTLARWGTNSDQILRTLQIASGTPVTVGAPSPGVTVSKDAATTSFQKAGILALLQAQPRPAPVGASPAPAPPPVPTISVQTGGGSVPVQQVPVSVVTNPSPGLAAPAAPIFNAPSQPGASVPLSSILGMTPAIDPSTGLPYAPGAGPPALTGSALATTPVTPAAPAGPFDFLTAPITLPLVGAVPTYGVVGGAAALAYLAWRRSKRRSKRGR